MNDLEDIATRIKALTCADRLRLAADLLGGAKALDNVALLKIARSIVDKVAAEIRQSVDQAGTPAP